MLGRFSSSTPLTPLPFELFDPIYVRCGFLSNSSYIFWLIYDLRLLSYIDPVFLMTFPCLLWTVVCSQLFPIVWQSVCSWRTFLYACQTTVFKNARVEGKKLILIFWWDRIPSPSQDVGDDDCDGWKCSVGSRQWRRWSVREGGMEPGQFEFAMES